MSVRLIPLFDAARKPTPFLIAQWRAKAATQPLLAGVALLETDLSAKPTFRSLWRVAFPSRDPLPFGPLAEKDGTGTDAFWRNFV